MEWLLGRPDENRDKRRAGHGASDNHIDFGYTAARATTSTIPARHFLRSPIQFGDGAAVALLFQVMGARAQRHAFGEYFLSEIGREIENNGGLGEAHWVSAGCFRTAFVPSRQSGAGRSLSDAVD
jgi:hypothetical protein